MGAAVAFALASVLQQRAAADVAPEHALRVGLLARLARDPRFVAGMASDVSGFALQSAALAVGSLVVVQVLLTTGLLYALPLSAALLGHRLVPREWAAAAAIAIGVAVFVTVGDPREGRADAPAGTWLALFGVVLVGAVLCVAVARAVAVDAPALRAGLLAGATAIVYSATAALTKTSVDLLRGGFANLVTSWPPYALAIGALGAMVLAQSAFQAGSLSASLPVLTIADPVLGTLVGVTVFHERLAGGTLRAVVLAAASLAMAAGVVVLATSPFAHVVHGPEPAGRTTGGTAGGSAAPAPGTPG